LERSYRVANQISAYRIGLYAYGCRDGTEEAEFRVDMDVSFFEGHKYEWEERLADWKTLVEKLRRQYPFLTFFTVNELRVLSEWFTEEVCCVCVCAHVCEVQRALRTKQSRQENTQKPG